MLRRSALSGSPWSRAVTFPPSVTIREVHTLCGDVRESTISRGKTTEDVHKMSFYLRKSVKVGPLRVNLSKSGLGVSTGIPGFRVGHGPRGSYVRMGAGGIFYQSTLRARNARTHGGFVRQADLLPAPVTNGYSPGEVVLSDVTGAQSITLLPAQPSELVSQLNTAAKAHRFWPWSLAATVVLSANVSPWLLLVGVPLTIWLWWRDKVRRTVVVFYEVDGPDQSRYQALVNAFRDARETQQAWHVVASGNVRTTYQYKVNAGATSIERREPLAREFGGPPNMSTNIEIPTLRSAERSVYFLPDRILIKDRNVYADLGYGALHINSVPERFIESGRVPSDSTLVATTWKFVNKNGGPDRRFKNNRQLPIMLYGSLTLQATAGLNMQLSFSRPAVAQVLAAALTGMRANPSQGQPWM